MLAGKDWKDFQSCFFSKIATLKKKFGGSKILTRIAIHIFVKKGELLIWRKNGHFPHCVMVGPGLPIIRT
jgi:hypothetical protein